MDAHRPDAAARRRATCRRSRRTHGCSTSATQLGRTDGHAQYLAGHVPGCGLRRPRRRARRPGRRRLARPAPAAGSGAVRAARCGAAGSPATRPSWSTTTGMGAAATRAWWLLTYHGHPDVRVLDGGWQGYLATGGPRGRGRGRAGAGDFRAEPGHLPVLDAAGAARLARDGRAGRRTGARALSRGDRADRPGGRAHPRRGERCRSPRSTWSPARTRRDRGSGTWTTPRALYERAGVRTDREVGVYCGSGVTATHTVFTLHRLGVAAALYPGSWSEWVADPDRPVATGA